MLGSYIISWSIRLTTGAPSATPPGCMRMFNRRLVREFAQNPELRPRAGHHQLPDQERCQILRKLQVEMGERMAARTTWPSGAACGIWSKWLSHLADQWFTKRDTATPFPNGACRNVRSNAYSHLPDFGQPIRQWYILRRVSG